MGNPQSNMISLNDFKKLRISNFFDASGIFATDGWEYLGQEWHGEMVGFTQFSHDYTSGNLGALSVDMRMSPGKAQEIILATLGFNIDLNLKPQEIVSRLGSPTNRYSFAPDRETLEYHHFESGELDISITALQTGGVIGINASDPAIRTMKPIC